MGMPWALLWAYACVGTGVSTTCQCDLTTQCDINCCCDTNCKGWQQGFDCLDAAREPAVSHMCSSSSYMQKINPTAGLSVFDEFNNLLCVEVDNNPVVGRLHTNNKRAASVSDIKTELTSQQLTSFSVPIFPGFSSNVNAHHTYRASEVIPAYKKIDPTTGQVAPLETNGELSGDLSLKQIEGLLTIPMPNAGGECYDSPIRFLQDIPARLCRQPVNLQAACQLVDSTFAPLTSDLPSGDAISGLLSFRHTLGSTIVPGRNPVTAEARCDPARNKTVLLWDAGRWKEHGTLLPGAACAAKRGASASFKPIGNLRWNQSAPYAGVAAPVCACENAVVAQHYRIFYEPALNGDKWQSVSVARIDVEVTYADLISKECAVVEVTQNNSVSFIQKNTTLERRSGNPGYVVGSETRLAVCDESDALQHCKVFKASPGLPYQGGFVGFTGIQADGNCVLTSETIESTLRQARFGEDASFGCTAAMTRAEWESFCDTNDDHFLLFRRAKSSKGTITTWPFPFTHVGAFGNAKVNQIADDWVLVENIEEKRIGEPGPCTKLVGLEFTFMYEHVGEFTDPQRKIVVARGQKIRASLSYTVRPSEKQRFFFNIILKFVRRSDDEELTPRVQPFPPLPVKLPHDFFYPFLMSDAPPS